MRQFVIFFDDSTPSKQIFAVMVLDLAGTFESVWTQDGKKQFKILIHYILVFSSGTSTPRLDPNSKESGWKRTIFSKFCLVFGSFSHKRTHYFIFFSKPDSDFETRMDPTRPDLSGLGTAFYSWGHDVNTFSYSNFCCGKTLKIWKQKRAWGYDSPTHFVTFKIPVS